MRGDLPPSLASLDSQLPTGPARPAPSIDTAHTGSWIGVLTIPTLGLTQAIIEGTGEGQLSQGPGHYSSTPLPGSAGNSALAGHRTTWGEPFRHLDQLKRDDPIIVTTGSGRFLYRVIRNIVVNPDDGLVIAPTRSNLLTLTTCNPPYSAASRLVIQATLTNSTLLNDPGATHTFLQRANSHPRSSSPSRGMAAALVVIDLVALVGLAVMLERSRRLWKSRRWMPGLLVVITLLLVTQLFHNALWILPSGW